MTTSAFWDERYGAAELVYGAVPNEFLVEAMTGLGWAEVERHPHPPVQSNGHLLPPSREKGDARAAMDIGAGEGRNALYLASLGLDVLAVDQSAVGMAKAERLAAERGLKLRTVAADLREFDAEPASLDVVSSIYVHMPAEIRARVHGRIAAWLKPGGVFVLEAYAPDQISRGTGGPKDPALLASLETIVSELKGLTIVQRAAKVRIVNEGVFHTGEASVVQVVAQMAK